MNTIRVQFTKLEQVAHDPVANQPHAWSYFEIHATGREPVLSRARSDIHGPARMEALSTKLPDDMPAWVSRDALEQACAHYRREVISAYIYGGDTATRSGAIVNDFEVISVALTLHYIERDGVWLLDRQESDARQGGL